MNRRNFITTAGTAGVGALLSSIPGVAASQKKSNQKTASKSSKTRVAIVGTGSRGTRMWGKTVIDNYGDLEIGRAHV